MQKIEVDFKLRSIDPLKKRSLELLNDIKRFVDTKAFTALGLSRGLVIPEGDVGMRLKWLERSGYIAPLGEGKYELARIGKVHDEQLAAKQGEV